MRRIALTLLALPSIAFAQTPDLLPKIDAMFAPFDRNTPGCGVALAKNGMPLLTKGYGAANLEYGIPNTDSTVFESGSVAKQFTAAALVLLEQDGKLSPTTTFENSCPRCRVSVDRKSRFAICSRTRADCVISGGCC